MAVPAPAVALAGADAVRFAPARREVTEKLANPFSSAAAVPAERATAPDPAAGLLGSIIGGRYRITRIVGRGGMGVVYGGEHLELGLPVAIKVLPTSYARDVETLKRFEREARTASRVRHPNVVTVFDLGRLDSGEPYLAMELLVGRDLSDIVDGCRALPLKEVLEILEPLAAALDALHAEGVVHRDIKPSNIFFSRGAGGIETLKLVDFGLAALHSAEGVERLTRSGHVIGTAVYMAPEGARGALVGPAGDVYSVGVVAFELLTGQPPFDGQPMAVLMDKVAGPAPSLAEIGGRPFDPRLEAAIAGVLARDPANRPQTVGAFVATLRTVLASGGAARSDPPPRPARPVSDEDLRELGAPPSRATASQELPKLPVRSRAPIVAALAVGLLAVTAGGGWYARQGAQAAVPTVPATPPPTPVVVPAPVAPTPAPIALVPVAPEPVAREPAAREPVAVAAPEGQRAGTDRAHPTTARAPSPLPHDETAVSLTPVPTPRPSTPEPEPEPEPEPTDRTAALLRDASSAMLHGEIPHARELYREATLSAPRNTAAWRGLGLSSERLGLVPEARRAYARYLELAPDARDATTVRERLDRLGS